MLMDLDSTIAENTIEIIFFSFAWQASTEHYLKMLMDLDWPYQN